jgi:Gram-negative bacterial TonB protein C-terminal
MKFIVMLFCLITCDASAQEPLDMGIGDRYDSPEQIARIRNQILQKKKLLKTKNPLYIINDIIEPSIAAKDTAFIMRLEIILPKIAIKKYGAKGKNGALDIFISEPKIMITDGFTTIPKNIIEKIELDTVKNQEISFKNDFGRFLQRNFNYPERALGDSIGGIVTIKFDVEIDGSVSNVLLDETSSSKNMELVEESIRLIKRSSGNWKPLIINGMRKKGEYKQKIYFVLTKE